MKRLSLLLTILGTVQAERVFLNNGSVRVGTISGADNQSITLVVDGRPERISKSEIAVVLFDGAPSVPKGRSLVPSPTGPDPVAPLSQTIATVEGLRIELLKCGKQAQSAIVCDFRVTNLEVDQVIALRGSFNGLTRYVDAKGNERTATSCKLGSKSGNSYVSTTIVQSVPVLGSVTLPPVEAGITSLAKLTIWFDKRSKRDFPAEFRNVPLQAN